MTTTAIVVLLFAVPLGFVLQRLLNDQAVLALEHRADLAARQIDLTSPLDAPDASEFPLGPDHFALYSPSGIRRTGIGPNRLEQRLVTVASKTTVTRRVHGQLISVVPITSGEASLGYLRAERSGAKTRQAIRKAIGLLIFGVAVVLVVGWILARQLASRIAASTASLRLAAIQIGNGNFTARASSSGISELDDIGAALSSTAQNLDEMVAREKSFSADTSHQLRTPLAGLRASLEAELSFPRSDPRIAIQESLSDVARLEQIVTDLLRLARLERDNDAIVDVLRVAADARDRWNESFARKGRPLVLRGKVDDIDAYGQTELLRQAIDALLDNALTHGDGLTEIVLECGSPTDDDDGTDSVVVGICDHGPGFPLTPDERSSTGLGLSLANRLVIAQGGRLVTARARPHPIQKIVLRRVVVRAPFSHQTPQDNQ